MPLSPRDDLMIRAAWMYYYDDMTHQQIAEKLHTSRVKITRLLQEARQRGLVEIKVLHPLPQHYDLARRLEKTFGLQNAVVVNNGSAGVGMAAAEYFWQHVKPGCIIGFGWSSTVRLMADYVKAPEQPLPCQVVDLVGSMLGQVNPYSVSGYIAKVIGGDFYPLSVPVLMQSPLARQALLAEPTIHANLELARHSDLAFVGVGHIGSHATLVTSGHLAAEDMQNLQAQGVVGDMLMRYFDLQGRPVSTHWDEQVIGLTWDELAAIPHVVAVAYGTHKAATLLGAVRSGVLAAIITDTDTAQAILDLT